MSYKNSSLYSLTPIQETLLGLLEQERSIPKNIFKQIILTLVTIVKGNIEEIFGYLNARKLGAYCTFREIKEAIDKNKYLSKDLRNRLEKIIKNNKDLKEDKPPVECKLIYDFPAKSLTDSNPTNYRTIKFKINQYINRKADNKNMLLEEIRSRVRRTKRALIEISHFILFHVSRGYNLAQSEADKPFSSYRLFKLDKNSMRKIFQLIFSEKIEAEPETPNNKQPNQSKKRKALPDKENDKKKKKKENSETSTNENKVKFETNIENLADVEESVRQYRNLAPSKPSFNTENLSFLMDDIYTMYETNINQHLKNIPELLIRKHLRNHEFVYSYINDFLRKADLVVADEFKELHRLWHNSQEYEAYENDLNNRLLIILTLVNLDQTNRTTTNIDVAPSTSKDANNNDLLVILDDDSESEFDSVEKFGFDNKSKKEEEKLYNKQKDNYFKFAKEHLTSRQFRNIMKIRKNINCINNVSKSSKEKEMNDEQKNNVEKKIIKEKNKTIKKKHKISACIIPLPSNELHFVMFGMTSILRLLTKKGIGYESIDNPAIIIENFFNLYFNNEEMIKKFNYDPRIYRAVNFSTDGVVVNLLIEKLFVQNNKRMENIDNIIKSKNLTQIKGIDPGIDDFLTITQIKYENIFNPYPVKNDNNEEVLNAKDEIVKVADRDTKHQKEYISTKTISTAEYYHKIKLKSQQFVIEKYRRENKDFDDYLKGTPCYKTSNHDLIIKYIK